MLDTLVFFIYYKWIDKFNENCQYFGPVDSVDSKYVLVSAILIITLILTLLLIRREKRYNRNYRMTALHVRVFLDYFRHHNLHRVYRQVVNSEEYKK